MVKVRMTTEQIYVYQKVCVWEFFDVLWYSECEIYQIVTSKLFLMFCR